VPARLVRLTPAGAAALDAALLGVAPDRMREREVRLLARLVDAELIHPIGADSSQLTVTTVIPTRNGASRIGALVAELAPAGTVIVVDDGSTDSSADVAAAAGAIVLPNLDLPGPAAARNTGLAKVETELVVFLDDDCVASAGWHARLTSLFDVEPGLALAAPRVRSVPGKAALARYEAHCSPLDLGYRPGIVAPGRWITYVPSAALVARRSALLSIGGFDPRLRVGEDVDLVWRLIERGWRVRYAPETVVLHHPRKHVCHMARQRFDYGQSAALLERRHPGSAAPLRVTAPAAAVYVAGITLGAAGAAGAIAISLGAAAAALRRNTAARQALVMLALRGHLSTNRHAARLLVREWLPISVLSSILSGRARRVVLAALVIDAAASGANPALRLLDNAAYSAGLWRGVVAARSVSALTVRKARFPHATPLSKGRHGPSNTKTA
jgi:mycofactocin system glycosyltransferase